MALIQFFFPKGKSGFGFSSSAEEVIKNIDISNKVYLITGCNSGLGFETVKTLCKNGATVLSCAKTIEKSYNSCNKISRNALPFACDLSEPKSIYKLIDEVKKSGYLLDGIIANAAVMALPFLELKFGYEKQFFTNHIGHFILVNNLLPLLKPKGRIVILSSISHKWTYKEGIQFDNLDGKKGYSPWLAYGQSKLCNLLFAKHLAKKIKKNQTSNSLHPGMIATNLNRHLPSYRKFLFKLSENIFLKSIPQGAATQSYVLTNPDLDEISGYYFSDCNIKIPSIYGQNDQLAKKLWQISEKIINSL